MEIRSLAVLAAEQVAAHISEEDILKLAPLHVNLIRGMRIKRKKDKGKGKWSPTAAQPKKKKTRKNEQDLLENSGGIRLGNITNTGKPATTLDKRIEKD